MAEARTLAVAEPAGEGDAVQEAPRARVLYISYDGLLEPLGQSQVLQYQERLAANHDITLISYEKREDWDDVERRTALAQTLKRAGIRWRPLRYHKRPSALATAYDIQLGVLTAARLVRKHKITVVHARSYVSGVIALAMKRMLGTRFIFDMRGFWPDERVDGGLWQAGARVYRVAKWYERRFFTSADVVISLTEAGATAIRQLEYLRPQPPKIEVIPTCTNLERFRPAAGGGERGASFTLGYVGSVGTWYLFDHVLECFRALLEIRPDARLLIVNRSDHVYVRERMKAAGVQADRVELKAVHYPDVPTEMARMDAGIFFYKPTFSRLGTAPTKLGEFLGCGIPCLANAGVGDVEAVLEGDGVGVVVRDFDPATQLDAMRRLVELAAEPEMRARCVEVARRRFALERGVRSYDQVYRSLAEGAA